LTLLGGGGEGSFWPKRGEIGTGKKKLVLLAGEGQGMSHVREA
jgi:hypothetical protein